MKFRHKRLVRRRSPDVHWCDMQFEFGGTAWVHNRENGRSCTFDFKTGRQTRKNNGRTRLNGGGAKVELFFYTTPKCKTRITYFAPNLRAAHDFAISMGWPSPWKLK